MLRIEGVELCVGHFCSAHPEPADGLTVERPAGHVNEFERLIVWQRDRPCLLRVKRFLKHDLRDWRSCFARQDPCVDLLFGRKHRFDRSGNIRIPNPFLILNRAAVHLPQVFPQTRQPVCSLTAADLDPRSVERRVHVDPGRQAVPVLRGKHFRNSVMSCRIISERLEKPRRGNVELTRRKEMNVRFDRVSPHESAQIQVRAGKSGSIIVRAAVGCERNVVRIFQRERLRHAGQRRVVFVPIFRMAPNAVFIQNGLNFSSE